MSRCTLNWICGILQLRSVEYIQVYRVYTLGAFHRSSLVAKRSIESFSHSRRTLDKAIIYSGGHLCLTFWSGFHVDYGQDESDARRGTFVYSRTTSILVPRRVARRAARRNFKSVHLGLPPRLGRPRSISQEVAKFKPMSDGITSFPFGDWMTSALLPEVVSIISYDTDGNTITMPKTDAWLDALTTRAFLPAWHFNPKDRRI